MSVVHKNNDGWVLDHCQSSLLHINCGNGVKSKATDGVPCYKIETYRLKKDLFKVIEPFLMDSEFNRISSDAKDIIKEKDLKRRKRKRKRKHPLNIGEQFLEDYHQEVGKFILAAFQSLVDCKSSHFRSTMPIEGGQVKDNNLSARIASQICGAGDTFTEMSSSRICEAPVPVRELALDANIDDAVNVIWKHNSQYPRFVTLESSMYILPPKCTFLMSDLWNLNKACEGLGRFDLIVIDPPWTNKSVKRKRMYNIISDEMLLDLPLCDLMNPACLVVVWVTNKQKHIQFITEQLFKKCNIQTEARWCWLKVTISGQMVYDLNSPHKKPYETLIIGRYKQQDNGDSHGHERCLSDKVIISVPCSLHSKKPPLAEVLKQYIPNEPYCLELFARNLQPQFTSWGNEVLLHQHVDFYEKVT